MAPNVAKRLNIINNSMIKEFKYCSEVIKKNIFTKNLKKTMTILKTLLNVGFVTVIMLIMM